MGTHKQLLVWQKAEALSKLVYQATNAPPANERFNLISQMRRASVSITSNLAEGSGSRTTNDQLRYYGYAYASAAELESQVRTLENHQLVQASVILDLDEAIGHVFRLLHLLRKATIQRQPQPKNLTTWQDKKEIR